VAQRLNIFIVVCLLAVLTEPGSSQGKAFSVVPMPLVFEKDFPGKALDAQNTAMSYPFCQKPAARECCPLLPLIVQQGYYSKNLGFFCRKEWQLQQATRLPLRIRLGSLDYVNRLEGK
jgi:hypothetical protein